MALNDPQHAWRWSSVLYLLVALACFGLAIAGAHWHSVWIPLAIAGLAFLVIGARKGPPASV